MANLFLKRSKESRGKEGGEAYFVYSTHFMAGKFRSETEKILKIDLIYGESVTRIDILALAILLPELASWWSLPEKLCN